MYKISLFLSLVLITAILPIHAQEHPVELDWSETWDFEDELLPIRIQVDHQNNIYSAATVFKEENTDILLLKYSADNRLLWAKEFDNGDNEVVSGMVVRGNAI